MKPIALFTATALAVLVSAHAEANLLGNGSFETLNLGSADSSGPGYWTYNAGNTGIADWTVGGVSVDAVDTTYPVHSGNYGLDLVGTPGPGSISQAFTGVAGTETVSFWAESTGAPINDIVNVILGTSAQQFHVTNSWQKYTMTVTGLNAGTQILSLASDPLNTGSGNTFIDDVSVEATPEPASMAVLAIGAGALLQRRKTSKK